MSYLFFVFQLFSGLLFAVSCENGQENSLCKYRFPVNTTPLTPLFWKVQGVHNTVYLFGTIHQYPNTHRLFPALPTLEQAFNKSRYLLVEQDPNNVIKRLKKTIPQEKAQLEDLLREAKIEEKAFRALEQQLKQQLERLEDEDYVENAQKQSLEYYLISKAVDKKVIELESHLEMTDEPYCKFLNHFVEKYGENSKEYIQIKASVPQILYAEVLSSWECGNGQEGASSKAIAIAKSMLKNGEPIEKIIS
ncbi:MAG: TraB/GumN family protein [Amoebophilaceae bacterium]|nr:TraB/GumN family protein [Amoebophilaceae bacterium]